MRGDAENEIAIAGKEIALSESVNDI